jgi:hypothetical protein
MTSLSVSKVGGTGSTSVWTGDQALTFKRSDTSLAKTSLGTLSIPEGRYSAMTLGMGPTFTVKIDGNKYQGATSGSISTGTALYSTGTGDLTASNALGTSGTAVSISLAMSTGTSGPTSQTIFPQPVCVSSDASICKTGDYKLVQQGNTRGSTTVGTVPGDMNILMDLYHAIRVDASDLSAYFSNAYPVILYGDVGASVHLANTGTTPADIGLLFASDKSIQAIYGNSANSVQYPNGFAAVTTTSVPTDYPTISGMAFVGSVTATSTGTASFPMTSGSDGKSRGLIGLTGYIAAVDSTVSGTCTDDTTGTLTNSSGTFAWTGTTCTGGSNGGSGVSSTFNYLVERIVDPSNILGVCTSSPCLGSATDSDGYQ